MRGERHVSCRRRVGHWAQGFTMSPAPYPGCAAAGVARPFGSDRLSAGLAEVARSGLARARDSPSTFADGAGVVGRGTDAPSSPRATLDSDWAARDFSMGAM